MHREVKGSMVVHLLPDVSVFFCCWGLLALGTVAVRVPESKKLPPPPLLDSRGDVQSQGFDNVLVRAAEIAVEAFSSGAATIIGRRQSPPTSGSRHIKGLEMAIGRPGDVEEQRPLVQVLGVVVGGWCKETGQAVGHGCRLGCRCGALEVCNVKPYFDLDADLSATGLSDGEGEDIGVCELWTPAALAFLVGPFVMVGWIVLAVASKSRQKKQCGPRQRRKDLEKRLRKATPVSAEQCCFILDHLFTEGPGLKDRRRRLLRARFAEQREYRTTRPCCAEES